MELSNYVKGKKIIFGITGGIAAYKAANCVSALRRAGAEVYVVMTKNAIEFITPITMKTLSEHNVITDMFSDEGYVTHISLTEIADLFIVAPATANCIAKLRAGIADDMLSTMLLAYNKEILLVPSMNDNMFNNPATVENIQVLSNRNINFVFPETGKLATGKVGKGRFPEIDKILLKIVELIFIKPLINSISNNKFDIFKDIISKNSFLVTAGATREYIDPVRYISNGSSGKMGFGFMNAITSLGGNLKVITANYTDTRIDWFSPIKVGTTLELKDRLMENLNNIDWLIMAAAPSDYRIKESYDSKIKKTSEELNLTFIKNPDILQEIRKNNKQLNILGFAAETDELEKNGKEKLEKKKLNAICLNKVYKDEKGFNQDKNEIIFINKENFITKIELIDKEIVAYLVLYYLFKDKIG
ncbi:MAG: bifunctional phosphopantothenoylcysteine decarboxylase/phosphopantothenate--cysteine ligase CoaBC [Spirochaetales bacterium]|jgi:phosphopantothenoylcysteine decarboxylase/phosphopantothenate--cysteine ligase|nr:bifunctional phosphopantothenoylcysteine decarboxylase/phosphopantothenate--cysteine ligase CoaBC [Exilispira sp.]NMC67508.1 bifunctional phosphopantothenoylcysteine decarboxylase/phosphopantothenate--cysteine ligase CoaBC [Spirochaetales bacterium]